MHHNINSSHQSGFRTKIIRGSVSSYPFIANNAFSRTLIIFPPQRQICGAIEIELERERLQQVSTERYGTLLQFGRIFTRTAIMGI